MIIVTIGVKEGSSRLSIIFVIDSENVVRKVQETTNRIPFIRKKNTYF